VPSTENLWAVQGSKLKKKRKKTKEKEKERNCGASEVRYFPLN